MLTNPKIYAQAATLVRIVNDARQQLSCYCQASEAAASSSPSFGATGLQ